MDSITLTGWGQQYDSLHILAPDATAINYTPCDGIEPLFQLLQEKHQHCSIAIGWSLGAQLLVRAVAENILQPKLLVLLAPPFQYVASKAVPSGTNPLVFKTFATAFKHSPEGTLKQFAKLMGLHDSNKQTMFDTLDTDPSHHNDWVRWLDILQEFSCNRINFTHFPRTLIIHGDHDTITHVEQSRLFAKHIPNAQLEIFHHCGHAPHLHDRQRVLDLIEKEKAAL